MKVNNVLKTTVSVKHSVLLAALCLLTACGPSEQQKAQLAEKKRLECLDKICDGDVVPQVGAHEFVMKLNGQFFFAPREYGGYGGSLIFFWPSKMPANRNEAREEAPEFVPSAAGQTSNFYDVAIEIFLRSNNIASPDGKPYDLLVQADHEDRVIKKETLRPGLERWQTQDTSNLGPGYWYLATDYPDERGRPPVIWCRASNPKLDRCTTAFFIRPGIAADIRFRAQHSADWPEIYQEITRVLQLLRETSK